MIGYKGFDCNMQCHGGFQYAVGQQYTMDENQIQLCFSGFHFCQYPLDVFYYYGGDCLYARVKAEGKIIEGENKAVTSCLTILEMLTREQLIEAMPTAIVRKSGEKVWYLKENYHREDGPAIEHVDGTKEWYINGRRHRNDGPAFESSDGSRYWFFEGKLHRVDGPAIELANGTTEWYYAGLRHRDIGPAFENTDGYQQWWTYDKYISDNRHD